MNTDPMTLEPRIAVFADHDARYVGTFRLSSTNPTSGWRLFKYTRWHKGDLINSDAMFCDSRRTAEALLAKWNRQVHGNWTYDNLRELDLADAVAKAREEYP